MTAPAAELKGVSKKFGRGPAEVRALHGVDLEVHSCELTLIEGPSGSGKTTLLHILGLLQRPDAGQVWIGGRRLDELTESRLPDERRKNVAFIFQGYNLLDALTLRDNVAVAGLLTAGSRRATPVADYLHRLGLQDRLGHLPAELSGGEKQRATIARALACSGSLVLADEPTANLDWENAQEVVRSLADLAHRAGRAVVMVSHDSRLEPFADRIVSLLNGQISDDRRVRGTPMNRCSAATPAIPLASRRRGWAGRLTVWLGACLLVVLAGLTGLWYLGDRSSVPGGPGPGLEAAPPGLPYVAAAPAVVEPSTQLVALRTERQGRIKAVLKAAGDRVVRGEPLVLLDDATATAVVQQRRADLALAEANLAELKAWDRAEERAKAEAGVDRGRARLDRAERELERIRSLHADDFAPPTELNEAIEEQRLAAAALREAQQVLKMSQAGPTLEEMRVAEARVEQARAALHLAETELSLLTVTSPLDGHVVYRHLEPGEVVDPESPDPILSLGNLDRIRLRAEVDEADIQRVRVGQKVIATAEAFGDRKFPGRVAHLEPMMGRKNIRTERTTEQEDTKVREVLVELDEGTLLLPIDLQMTVRFLATPTPPTTASVPAEAGPSASRPS